MRVVEEVPRAGALGCLSLPLSPVPIHKPGLEYTLTEFAAAAVVEAILPRPMGRGGERRCNQCCAKPVLPGHLRGEKAKTDKVSVCIRLSAKQDLASPCVTREPPYSSASLSKPLPVTQTKLAQATYLLGVSSPVGWHGPGDYELKNMNGSRSNFLHQEAERQLPSPSQTTRPRPARMEGGGPSGLSLTDFAIHSHL